MVNFSFSEGSLSIRVRLVVEVENLNRIYLQKTKGVIV